MCISDDTMGDLGTPLHFHEALPEDQVISAEFGLRRSGDEDHALATTPVPMTDSSTVSLQPDPVRDVESDDLPLTKEHRQILQGDSAISISILRENGVQSITRENLTLLAELGFSPKQQAPGILFPHYTAWGDIRGYSLRRDDPLDKRKYEIPYGQRSTIYVPPSMLRSLRRPDEELYITEGIKKVLCGVSYGLPTIGLGGVNNWRGKNAFGGKTTLPDFHEIALNERKTIIIFDSDVMVKPQVRSALDGLTSVLRARGADVYWCLLPERI